jgi:hypothetical protein
MYHAGQVSMHRRNRLWQGFSGVLAALLLASIVWRSVPAGPQQHLETVAYEPPAALSASEPIDRQEVEAFRHYLRTRQAVLTHGIEALPASPVVRDGFDGTLSREDMDDLLS